MSVARIQLMPLCHPWGISFINKAKWPPCEIYIYYISICGTATGMILVDVLLFLPFRNSIRIIFMSLTWFYYVEAIFNFKMAAIHGNLPISPAVREQSLIYAFYPCISTQGTLIRLLLLTC